ncbi:MAG TPA: S41 family peptidase [Leadbetterella sp.]|nr:S41 family peptidase [Leadbetterella sp.]
MHRHFIISLFTILLIGLLSCSKKNIDINPTNNPKDSTSNVTPSKYLKENNWIYAQMKKYYLWEETMPAEAKTDKYLEPIKYYKSLVNDNQDWFSYMKSNKDDVLNFWLGTPYGYGFRFRPYKPDATKENIFLAVSLVSQQSPAEKAGLYRGDIIQKIEGNNITEGNLSSLLEKLNINITWQTTSNELKTAAIAKSSYRVKPIYDTRVIEIEKKKIGYFAFTQFLHDIDNDLRAVFNNFKAQKIDELILDLRFNPGGFTPNAEVVGSLIVKNLNPNEKMFGGHTNKAQTLEAQSKPDGNKDGRNWTNESANLNTLNRVYIITSKSTSSSSELVINCLKTKMEVILIGENTLGKNVISTIITDETGQFPFVIMPAYSTIENSKGESYYGRKEGFIPDFLVQDDILPYYPIGNQNETLLKKTLEIIQGNLSTNIKVDSGFYRVNFLDKNHHYDSHTPFVSN